MFEDITNITMGEALLVTVFSMTIVFASLLVINFILKGFKLFFYKENKKSKLKKDPKKVTTNVNNINTNVAYSNNENFEEDEEELVAVITAALAASLSKPVSDIRIKKIRRVNSNTSTWLKAGRLEQIN